MIASLHFSLQSGTRAVVTRRLLNAIENPHVDLIGHPRGQLIEERAPADLDMDAVSRPLSKHGTALEINANPTPPRSGSPVCPARGRMGILLSINTDAHRAEQMDLLPLRRTDRPARLGRG